MSLHRARAIPAPPATYYVYFDTAGTYHARNLYSNLDDYTGNDFSTVCNNALANIPSLSQSSQQGGAVYVMPGRHVLSTDLILPAMTARGGTAGIALLTLPFSEYGTELRINGNVLTKAAIVMGSDGVAEATNQVVDGFSIVFSGVTALYDGILVLGSKMTVRNVMMENITGYGLHHRTAVQTNTPSDVNYDNYVERCYLTNCGQGDAAHDAVYIESNVGDSEWYMVKVQGGPSASTHTYPRYGFHNGGNSNRFINCHPFYCASHGFHLDGSAVLGADANAPGRAQGCTVAFGESETNSGCGVYLNNVNQVDVHGVEMYGNTGSADIYGSAAKICTISANMIRSAIPGLVLAGQCRNNTVAHNIVHGAGTVGISVQGDATNDSSYNTLIGNQIDGATSHRLRLQDCTNNTVLGNICTFPGDAGPGDVYEADSASTRTGANTVAFNNVKSGGLTLKAGGGTLLADNTGYVSANSGSATIALGTTSITVNHGLAGTPGMVKYSALGDPAGRTWISGISATQFTINTSTAPSVNTTFEWEAAIRTVAG